MQAEKHVYIYTVDVMQCNTTTVQLICNKYASTIARAYGSALYIYRSSRACCTRRNVPGDA